MRNFSLLTLVLIMAATASCTTPQPNLYLRDMIFYALSPAEIIAYFKQCLAANGKSPNLNKIPDADSTYQINLVVNGDNVILDNFLVNPTSTGEQNNLNQHCINYSRRSFEIRSSEGFKTFAESKLSGGQNHKLIVTGKFSSTEAVLIEDEMPKQIYLIEALPASTDLSVFFLRFAGKQNGKMLFGYDMFFSNSPAKIDIGKYSPGIFSGKSATGSALDDRIK